MHECSGDVREGLCEILGKTGVEWRHELLKQHTRWRPFARFTDETFFNDSEL